jgi:3-methylcrotonyl-CoA carboxylase alpha subunit
MTRPIRKLLIANRGEIALRIARTARAMGIATVAVYSEADRDALHVRRADEAWAIGPAPARDSYLRGEAILAAARASGADAIHPGYGFLSEDADFAEAVAGAGLIFVGPPAKAIRAMGSKSAAKALMAKAGVPLVPGYHGKDQSPARLAREAAAIGWPVLIKASAGGGGKGMKVVRSHSAFDEALASARREAAAAFGDEEMLIERYLTRPRHVESQIFADGHANVVHLFERDCSIQRRHQKVIEEAPAPFLDRALAARIGGAAIEAARAVGYVGAGTVEFILEDDQFYFMEMNTRLQVEHPVTESVTKLDLVEWQLRVARGEPLPCRQDDIALSGHAVEARLYAEDPERDFLPQTGHLVHLVLPADLPGIRIDAGVASGDAVTRYYDPMLAKLIAHGADRREALDRLSAALAATEIAGLATNRRFLRRIAAHPAFAAGDFDTGFIERHRDDLLPSPAPPPPPILALAAAALLALRRAALPVDAADPWSPFATAGAFTPNLASLDEVGLLAGGTRTDVRLSTRRGRTIAEVAGEVLAVSIALRPGGDFIGQVEGARLAGRAILAAGHLDLILNGENHVFSIVDPHAAPDAADKDAGHLRAPMPGAVIAVVAAGTSVRKGMTLAVIEAMKMEHAVTAPADGVVAAVMVGVGDVVAEGADLVVLEPAAITVPTKDSAPEDSAL